MSRSRDKWKADCFLGPRAPELIERASAATGIEPRALMAAIYGARFRSIVERFGEDSVRAYTTGGRARRVSRREPDRCPA